MHRSSAIMARILPHRRARTPASKQETWFTWEETWFFFWSTSKRSKQAIPFCLKSFHVKTHINPHLRHTWGNKPSLRICTVCVEWTWPDTSLKHTGRRPAGVPAAPLFNTSARCTQTQLPFPWSFCSISFCWSSCHGHCQLSLDIYNSSVSPHVWTNKRRAMLFSRSAPQQARLNRGWNRRTKTCVCLPMLNYSKCS